MILKVKGANALGFYIKKRFTKLIHSRLRTEIGVKQCLHSRNYIDIGV